MNYIDFEADNKSYRLRLNTRSVVQLEKMLGCNPLHIFGSGDTVPTITVMVQILFAALQQYNHGLSMNDAYDIFDAYIADGHSSVDFIPVILDLYKASGIIPKDANEEKEEKNA